MLITHDELIEQLRAYVAQHRTITATAAALGISATFLGDVLRKRREPSAVIMNALGYRRLTMFEKIEDQSEEQSA